MIHIIGAFSGLAAAGVVYFGVQAVVSDVPPSLPDLVRLQVEMPDGAAPGGRSTIGVATWEFDGKLITAPVTVRYSGG